MIVEREIEIGFETGIEFKAVVVFIEVAHAAQGAAIDVRVVAAQAVLAAGDAVDEELQFVLVARRPLKAADALGFQIAGDEEIEIAVGDARVGGIQLGASYGEAGVAVGGVSKARRGVLHGDWRAVEVDVKLAIHGGRLRHRGGRETGEQEREGEGGGVGFHGVGGVDG